ncbi:unnamed protein product [Blumeria hordei]|uniref:Sister chromatid separation protein n=1 Tax=Blumeria hordei TaxID=2867405 RepID=A0A383URW5_BLUHO|nr:unnamed protein product [Blumeria hordei]
MADYDSLDFLQDNFDPASLTVPRLRSIFVTYNISYPSTAKKAQLIEIFTNQVLPMRNKILRERDRARRSSKGITNAGLTEVLGDEDKTILSSRTPRKSILTTKLGDDEKESLLKQETTISPEKKKRSSSSKHARTSDTESGIDLQFRRKSLRARMSETPINHEMGRTKVKYDVIDDGAGVEIVKRRESAFTYDNPFQSGSSPISERSSPGTKRKSLSTTRERRVTSGYATRSRVTSPQIDHGVHPPSRKSFQAPDLLYETPIKQKNDIETSEEFTPEEQLDLMKDKVDNPVTSRHAFRPKRWSSAVYGLKGPLWVIALTALCGYLAWYRQEKIAIGYCGVGKRPTTALSSTWEVPNWARTFVEPECEPCPQHAYCSSNMRAQCEHDYILKLHPLSFSGLIPLVPTCEPDGIKVRKVKAVADRAIDELRERRAKYECGELKDNTGVPETSAEIDAEELKKLMSSKRRKGMSEAEFEDLWAGGLLEVLGRDEISSTSDESQEVHIKLSSTSLTRLSLVCALRRSVRNTLAQYCFPIGGIVVSILLLVYCRKVITSMHKINAAIPNLVSVTLNRLAIQAALHQNDRGVDRWISIGQLRDDVLRDEHQVSKRESIWRKVRAVVETNCNVRASQKEDRNGEVSRVWEWIGALENVESDIRQKRCEKLENSGVFGFDKSSDPLPVKARWNESRPVY